MLLEEVIAAHIGRLFAGMEVRACYPFRLTRNADLELQEEAANDLLEMIEEEVGKTALRGSGAAGTGKRHAGQHPPNADGRAGSFRKRGLHG